MIKNQIVPFQFGTNQLRIIIINDEPFFIAKDICRSLDLSNTAMALKGLDDDEKLTSTLFISGQNRQVWLVNESGLYNLIFRSNKAKAEIISFAKKSAAIFNFLELMLRSQPSN